MRSFFFLLFLQLICTLPSNPSTTQPQKSSNSLSKYTPHPTSVFISLHNHRTRFKKRKHKHRSTSSAPDSTDEPLTDSKEEHSRIEVGSTDFWMRILLIFGLLCVAGLMAGLTIGLIALDSTHLHILKLSGTPKERYYASVVEPLRKRGHLLLSTLLLTNMLANETLPIILDDLLSGGWMAVVVSTALIVLFAEIIPQAVCSKYGLAIGAHAAWLVKLLMILLFPITWPIAKSLEYFLGEHHGTIYRRAELKELVTLHGQAAQGDLAEEEVRIIKSVLDLKSKAVFEVMTPLSETFMLSMDTVLDSKGLKLISTAGYSRIPIYIEDRHNIVGVMLAKDLIGMSEARTIRELRFLMRPILYFSLEDNLFNVLDRFLESKAHIAAVVRPESVPEFKVEVGCAEEHRSSDESSHTQSVTNSACTASTSPELTSSAILGIVTMEDILEAMIGEDIVDETDLYLNPKTKIENPSKLIFNQTVRKRKRSKKKKVGIPQRARRSHSLSSVIRFPHSWSPFSTQTRSNSDESLNFPKSS